MPNFILDDPGGIAVNNSNNRLYVTNLTQGRVLVFDRITRQYLFSIGSQGTAIGQFDQPTGIALDAAGNVYVSEWGNDRVQKFDADGNVDTNFGGGAGAIYGFNQPNGIAIDTNGGRDLMYVADEFNHRIRVFRLSDQTPIAQLGTGTQGNSATQFSNPRGVAVDPSGNIYIADSGNNLIKSYNSSRTPILTPLNTSTALTQFPYQITYYSGKLYIACLNGHLVRILDADDGDDQNYIGQGTAGSADGQFNGPVGIAVANDGIAYVSDYFNDRIQSFDANQATPTFLWRLATTTVFNGPVGVAVNEGLGRIYVTDSGNDRIQVFNTSGSFLFAFGITGSNAGEMDLPLGVAIDNSGNVYVTEAGTFQHRIQVFDSNGQYLSSFGSSGSGANQFSSPWQIDIGSDDRIYVADYMNRRVHVYNPNFIGSPFAPIQFGVGAQIRGVAVDDANNRIYVTYIEGANHYLYVFNKSDGTIDLSAGGDGIIGNNAGEPLFGTSGPYNVSVSAGNIYVTQVFNNAVRVINATTFADQGAKVPSASIGSLNNPTGIVSDAAGGFYVADYTNNRLVRFNSAFTSTWAVGVMAAANANGAFSNPTAVAVHPGPGADAGKVYVADRNNNRVQVFNATGGYLAKIDNGIGAGDNQVIQPSGVFISGGLLYVSDGGNNRIQIFDAATLTPACGSCRFGTSGTGPSQFLNPAGIWVANGKIYVADQSNNRVQVFDQAAPYNHVLSITGFAQPTGVAADASGNIFVADKNNGVVKIFNAAGGFLKTISGYSLGNDFAVPESVYVDANNVLYVSDTGNNRIVAFSLCTGTDWQTGVILSRWFFGTTGQGGGQFNMVAGIGMNPSTYRLYAADRGNQRVKIYTPLPFISLRKGCVVVPDGSLGENFNVGIPNDPISLPYYENGLTTFTIQNFGNATLSLTSVPNRVTISGVDQSSFFINQSGIAASLPANGTTTFTVAFRPTSAGPKTDATVSISNNETTSRQPYTFSLQGDTPNPNTYTYTWTGSMNSDFLTAGNWVRLSDGAARTTPKKWDILRFAGSVEVITNVPADTVGALLFSSSAKISFQPSVAGNILAVKGRIGVDVDLPSGNEMNIASDNSMEIHMVQTGGILNGSITLGNATGGNPSHRFIVKTQPITFGNAAVVRAKNISGSLFGTAAGNNLIVFSAGSTFISESGDHPFGLAAPNSKIVFQTGSTYTHRQATPPSLSSRTYGNFEYDYNGTSTVNTAGIPVTILNDFTVTQGTLTISQNQGFDVSEDVSVANGAAFRFLPTSATVFSLSGITTSTFGGNGTITFNANATLSVTKSIATAYVSLTSDLTIPGTLTVSVGDVNLNGHTVDLGMTGMLNENVLSNHIVKDNTATYDYLVSTCFPCMTDVIGGRIMASGRSVTGILNSDIAGLGISLLDSNTPYTVNIERFHYRGDNLGIKRVYHLTSSANPTNTTMIMQYADEDWNTATNPPLHEGDIFDMFRHITAGSAIGWENMGGGESHDMTNNTVTLTGINVSPFSKWTLGARNHPLPIELESFEAHAVDNTSVQIEWVTAQERDNLGFEIQKSTDGTEYAKIGFMDGQGNTFEPVEYSYTDRAFSTSSYYRLKQIDLDGNFVFSTVRFVRHTDSNERQALLAFPNPFTKELNFFLSGIDPAKDEVKLTLYNVRGDSFVEFRGTLNSAETIINDKADSLDQGIYIVAISCDVGYFICRVFKK